jgi:hypothetical protein
MQQAPASRGAPSRPALTPAEYEARINAAYAAKGISPEERAVIEARERPKVMDYMVKLTAMLKKGSKSR